MKPSHLLFSIAACFALPFAAKGATTYYVNNCGDNTNCNGTTAACWSAGSQPNCAKKTIQAGMSITTVVAGDTILVAEGTYTGDGNRDLTFPLDGSGNARAITVKCASCPETCIIDCQGSVPCEFNSPSQHRGFWFNQDHATNNSVVEGFTIKNGCKASGTYTSGGAILVDQSEPTIRGCIFERNTANNGGAIAFVGNDGGTLFQPVLENCTIGTIGNLNQTRSGGYGGGVACLHHADTIVRNCRINGNTAALRGGGLYWDVGSDPRIDACVIENNTAGTGGGGVFIQLKENPNPEIQPAPRILRSRIGPNNSTTNDKGGGIRVDGVLGEEAKIWIENCTIIQNHADASSGAGGGVAFLGPSSTGTSLTVVVVNCVIAGNSANSGGGLYVYEFTPTSFANVTLMHNTALGPNGGSAIFFEGRSSSSVSNTILWYDVSPPTQAQVRLGDSTSFWDKLTVQRSDIQDALPAHVLFNNNISPPLNPLFVDPDGNDNNATTILDNNYHLQDESPCNDRGSVLLVPPDELDLDGDGNPTQPIDRVPFDRDDLDRYVDDPPGPYLGVLDPPNYTEYVDIGAYESAGCTSDSQCDDEDECNGIETCIAGACVHTLVDDCNCNGIDDDCELAVIVDWKSIVTHGANNTIGLVIPSDSTFSESRNGGVTKLRLSFSSPIDPTTVSASNVIKCGNDVNGQPVDLSGITVTTTVLSGNAAVDINFSPKLPNYARYRVRLNGVEDVACHTITSNNERIFTSLFCDMTGDRRVNATDVGGVRSLEGTSPIDPNVTPQVRSDVDNDNDVDTTDTDSVRAEIPKDARYITNPSCP